MSFKDLSKFDPPNKVNSAVNPKIEPKDKSPGTVPAEIVPEPKQS